MVQSLVENGILIKNIFEINIFKSSKSRKNYGLDTFENR